MLDLLGVSISARSMPFADQLIGRSLLHPATPDEPMMLLSTASGVWEPDDAKFGVLKGEMLAVKSAGGGWWCYDTARGPEPEGGARVDARLRGPRGLRYGSLCLPVAMRRGARAAMKEMKETSTKPVSSGMIPSSGGLLMVRWSSLVALVAGAVVTFAAGAARADLLSACGGAVVDGNEMCQVEAHADCTGQCTPVNLTVACSAMLEVGCMGNCTATLPSCTGSCEASCMGSCKPGNFSCEGDCSATCEGNCSSACSGNSNMEQCTAECKASCGGHCHASCTGSPADCMGACQASCQGSCTGQANLMCDINCQAQGNANCTAMLTGGCQAQCNAGGAIFCNGNFINASDLQSCESQLESLLNIQVSGSASAGCDGGGCEAEAQGQASASCDMAPGDAPPLSAGLLGIGLGATVIGVVRRRRARK